MLEDAAIIDPVAMARLDRLGGTKFVLKMIDLFSTDAPVRLAAAQSAEQAGNWKGVGEAAHSLKSSAGNFGAHTLGAIAAKLEECAVEGRNEAIPALMRQLETALPAALQLLQLKREALLAP